MIFRQLCIAAALSALTVSLSMPAMAQQNPHAGHAMPAASENKNGPQIYRTSGIVKSIQIEKGRALIDHAPIPELKWPAMNMPFEIPDTTLLNSLKPEQAIDFEFQINAKGQSTIIQILNYNKK